MIFGSSTGGIACFGLVFVFASLGVVGYFTYLFFGFLASVVQSMFGFRPESSQAAELPGERRECSVRACRHLNPPAARFCGRCGRPLDRD